MKKKKVKCERDRNSDDKLEMNKVIQGRDI